MAQGVDFSLLQPLPQPKTGVIAKLPDDQSPLDSLAQGLSSGIKDFEANKMDNEKIEQGQELIDIEKDKQQQSDKMFPIQYQAAQNALTADNMDLAAKKQQAQDSTTLRTAAQQNYQTYLNKLQQIDPQAWISTQKNMADTQKAYADAANTMEDEKKKGIDNYSQLSITGGNMASVAMKNGKNPQQQEQIYQQELSYLPESLRSIYPTTLQGNSANMILLGTNASLDVQDKKLANQMPTNDMKELQRIGLLQGLQKQGSITSAQQTELDGLIQHQNEGMMSNNDKDAQRIAQLTQLTNNGNITPQQSQELTLLQSKQQQNVKNPYDAALSSQDAKIASSSFNTESTLVNVHDLMMQAKGILTNVPGSYTGPVVDYLKANGRNSDIQKLNAIMAQVAFLSKSLVGITAGMRFTGQELLQLNKINGSSATNKDAWMYLIDNAIAKSSLSAHDQWAIQDGIRSNGSKAIYDKWKQNNPDPAPFKLPTFANQSEFQSWFKQQNLQTQQDVRRILTPAQDPNSQPAPASAPGGQPPPNPSMQQPGQQMMPGMPQGGQ